MNKPITLFLLLLLNSINTLAQPFIPGQTYFSDSGYVEYRCGNLPIIFSAPHDGALEPTQIPDRTCNNPTLVRDIRCADVAAAVDTALMLLTGCRPHIIICHLHRKKADVNRDLADGACGNTDAENAWNAFHQYLDSARSLATQMHGKGFYIDFHGHGHDTQQLELGYLLTKTELQNSDVFLDNNQYDTTSSIRHLSQTNLNGESFSELLRGPNAFGTLLANKGYPSVPSQQKPFPPAIEPYFNGGYNTVHYTSYMGGSIDGLQIESNWTGVRDNYANRKKFADSLAATLSYYMTYHMFGNQNFMNCDVSIQQENTSTVFSVYPNPSTGRVTISGNKIAGSNYIVSDLTGRTIAKGTLESDTNSVSLPVSPGFYSIQLTLNGQRFFTKLIVN